MMKYFVKSKILRNIANVMLSVVISIVIAVTYCFYSVYDEINKDMKLLDHIISNSLSSFVDSHEKIFPNTFTRNCLQSDIDKLKGIFSSQKLTAIPIIKSSSGYCSPFGVLNLDKKAFLGDTTKFYNNETWTVGKVMVSSLHNDIIYFYGFNGRNGFLYPIRKDYLFFEEDSREQRFLVASLSNSGDYIFTIGNMPPSQRLYNIIYKSNFMPLDYNAYISKQRIIDRVIDFFFPDSFLLFFSVFSMFWAFTSYVYTREELKMYSLLSSCEVVPFYQPIVDVNNNKIEGVEALIRLKDKKGNLIFPSEFIDYAENNEIIIPMTQRMIEKSFDDLSFLLEGNGDFYVSVNIVARHLENSDLYNYLKGLNIPFENLSLELTERQVIKDWEVAIETVSNLKTLGLSFSLDDAGTGFGGNSYLQYLDFDSVKIDKVFVDSIRLGDAGVLDSYILMLQKLDLNIIAEGVESIVESKELKSKGVYKHQGYYYAKPMPIDKLIIWYKERSNY